MCQMEYVVYQRKKKCSVITLDGEIFTRPVQNPRQVALPCRAKHIFYKKKNHPVTSKHAVNGA